MSIAYNPSIVGAKSDDLLLHLDAGSKVSIPNRTEDTAQEWVDLSKYTTNGAPQYDAIISHTPELPSGHAYPPFSNAFGGCLLYSNVTKLQTRLPDSYFFNEFGHYTYTISIWFQTASSFNAGDGGSRGLITTGGTDNGFHFYHVHNASFDRLYVGAHSSNGGNPTGSYYDIEPSTWYNATLVLNTNHSQDLTSMQSDALKIYVNGDLIGNHSFTKMGANGGDLFYIGGGGSSNLDASDELYGYDDHSKLLYSYLSTGSKHEGAISSVLMYQRALTELEVKQNFNALRGRYSL